MLDALLDLPLTLLVAYVGLLDSMPDYWRALIAGGLLVVVLRLSRRRIPDHDVQFSLSFTKVSLLVLAITPVVVWWLPATRLAVFVERLDPPPPAHLAWLLVLGVWAGGFVLGAGRLLAGYLRQWAALGKRPVVDEENKLHGRLRHWQRRLGVRQRLSLVFAPGPLAHHLAGARRVALPQAAEHWPMAATDLVLIQALCRMRKNQGAWFLFGQLVACAYWPVPWVRHLTERLLRDFHTATDTLAAACYQDDIGYQRALRQVAQRSTGPAESRWDNPAPAGPGGVGPTAALASYREHLHAVFRPAPAFACNAAALNVAHDRRRDAVWTEPGEKLVVLVGQAVLVALVVGGVTLQETPPEIERDFSITLDPEWMNTAFRDPARYEAPAPRPGRARGSPEPAPARASE